MSQARSVGGSAEASERAGIVRARWRRMRKGRAGGRAAVPSALAPVRGTGTCAAGMGTAAQLEWPCGLGGQRHGEPAGEVVVDPATGGGDRAADLVDRER